MKANQKLHDLGQSLWIDHITRDLLNSGMLKHYIEEFSVTGLTSNPAIFGYTVKNSSVYDAAIRKTTQGKQVGGKNCFWNSSWRTSVRLPTSSGRSTTKPMAWKGGLGKLLE